MGTKKDRFRVVQLREYGRSGRLWDTWFEIEKRTLFGWRVLRCRPFGPAFRYRDPRHVYRAISALRKGNPVNKIIREVQDDD